MLILAVGGAAAGEGGHQRQKEAELRRSLREMRTAIDKFKDAADAQMIPPTELKLGSEGYPPTLEIAGRGRVTSPTMPPAAS